MLLSEHVTQVRVLTSRMSSGRGLTQTILVDERGTRRRGQLVRRVVQLSEKFAMLSMTDHAHDDKQGQQERQRAQHNAQDHEEYLVLFRLR